MKKIVILLSLIFIIITLSACKNSAQPMVSMFELQEALISCDDTLPEMLKVNSNGKSPEINFENVSDLDYKKVEGYTIIYDKEGMANEIVVICLYDDKDVEIAKESLEAHKEKRILAYKNYYPDEVPKAENAKITSYGRYVALIMCDNIDIVEKTFEDFVK